MGSLSKKYSATIVQTLSLSSCGCAEMTASEPLSLEEEYAMQQSWRDDDKSKQSNRQYLYKGKRAHGD